MRAYNSSLDIGRVIPKPTNIQRLIQGPHDIQAVHGVTGPINFLRSAHEAEVSRTSVRDLCVPGTGDGGLEMFAGEGVANLVLQAIVADTVVRTADPDLEGREGGRERGGRGGREGGREGLLFED